MYSSILTTEATKYLPRKVTLAALSSGLPRSSLPALLQGVTSGDLSTVPGMSPEVLVAVSAAVKDAYARSYQTVYLCTLPFGALLIFSALFSPNVERYLTDEVARKLHGTLNAGKDEAVTVQHVEKA